MKFVKVLELSVFFLLLIFFLGTDLFALLLIPIYIYSLRSFLKEEGEKTKRRLLLEELSDFSNLLEQGFSPLYAYEKTGSFNYPSFMLHPDDELFRFEIFEKQFQLFEKSVILEEEIEGEILGIRLKMSIMKLMPLGLLLFIGRLLPMADSSNLNRIVTVLFLINHWIGERFLKSL